MDNRTPSERFWSKVNRLGPDDCWHWNAFITSNGYGGFRFRGRTAGAHRFSYEQANGDIPNSLVIDHNCHNLDEACEGGSTCLHRRCVNPSHLRAVPQAVNLLASRHTVNNASASATHCPYGHPYAGDNLGHDGTDRTCRTCKRAAGVATAHKYAAAKRERYAILRAAGLSADEARSASKRKVGAL